MFYKSVIIHKNRIFPCFQNKLKKLNNIIIIIIIIIIIKIREIIIQKKNELKERIYNCFKVILSLVLFRINLAQIRG